MRVRAAGADRGRAYDATPSVGGGGGFGADVRSSAASAGAEVASRGGSRLAASLGGLGDRRSGLGRRGRCVAVRGPVAGRRDVSTAALRVRSARCLGGRLGRGLGDRLGDAGAATSMTGTASAAASASAATAVRPRRGSAEPFVGLRRGAAAGAVPRGRPRRRRRRCGCRSASRSAGRPAGRSGPRGRWRARASAPARSRSRSGAPRRCRR